MKQLNILKLIIITTIVICFIMSNIISSDSHHLEICHEEECAICNIIHIAQNIMSILIAIIMLVIIGFLINLFLSRMHKIYLSFVQLPLVFQKVQLNE